LPVFICRKNYSQWPGQSNGYGMFLLHQQPGWRPKYEQWTYMNLWLHMGWM
jgi:hypothetical protein